MANLQRALEIAVESHKNQKQKDGSLRIRPLNWPHRNDPYLLSLPGNRKTKQWSCHKEPI